VTKATTEDKEERTNQICEMILRQVPTREIIARCMAAWSITDRQVKRYLHSARSELRELSRKSRGERLEDHLVVCENLRQKLYEEEDFKTLISVLRYEAELTGLRFDLPDHIKAVLEAGYEVRKPDD
jgi:hypothetical protein